MDCFHSLKSSHHSNCRHVVRHGSIYTRIPPRFHSTSLPHRTHPWGSTHRSWRLVCQHPLPCLRGLSSHHLGGVGACVGAAVLVAAPSAPDSVLMTQPFVPAGLDNATPAPAPAPAPAPSPALPPAPAQAPSSSVPTCPAAAPLRPPSPQSRGLNRQAASCASLEPSARICGHTCWRAVETWAASK